MKEAVELFEQEIIELKATENLRLHELNGIPSRVESLKQEVSLQQSRQTELQNRYKQLSQTLESLV